MKVYRYQMIDPVEKDVLPAGCIAYEVFKDEIQGHWGYVDYDRPLTGTEVDRFNLDGPVTEYVLMEQIEERFLITRQQAARRYSMSQRQFDELYRQHDDFPMLHIGKRVMVPREQADAWFTRYIRDVIEVG